MKCVFEHVSDIAPSHNGWRAVRCVRKGCPLNAKPMFSPDPLNRIRARCKGLPLSTEYREWLALFSAAAGVTRAIAICQYVRWRFSGSKLEELPPGIPNPQTPKNAGLSDAEIKELGLDSDPSLLGNRIAALTKAIGIPHCGGCEARRQWLNKAHEWLRGQ